MYKKYIEHVQSKTPHHRRQHAAQVAGVITVFAVVVWLTTLGLRFAPGTVAGDENANQTQLAGAGASNPVEAGVAGNAHKGIEVVGTTTSDFSNY